MKKIKSYNYNDLLKNELKNKEFKKEYTSLEEEFSLAKEIINLRKSYKLTQKQLADKVGTSQPAIARIESGNYKNISLSFLRRVAKALDAVPVIHLKRKTGL
ncbi:MAG: helix-turn-helix transcriptional regulator [Spirochaetes bacterium]|nr:helix-turn-helix transcriptional regulator [Spirochaetota bacterium]